jgi:hypothetical protein
MGEISMKNHGIFHKDFSNITPHLCTGLLTSFGHIEATFFIERDWFILAQLISLNRVRNERDFHITTGFL